MTRSKKVFIVHGRYEEARRAVTELLRALGLEVIEWGHAVALAKSASPYNGEVVDAAFAEAAAIVVVYAGEDRAVPQASLGDDAGGLQPRPNVLIETGMALQKDRSRTVIVELGVSRLASDLAGVNTVRLEGARPADFVRFRKRIADRVRAAGCDVSMEGDDWLEAGDFAAVAAELPLLSATPAPLSALPSWIQGARSMLADLPFDDAASLRSLLSHVRLNVRLCVPNPSDVLEELPAEERFYANAFFSSPTPEEKAAAWKKALEK